MDDSSIDRGISLQQKKDELIRLVGEPRFLAEVRKCASYLTKGGRDAEDDVQEAIVRFISAVKSKNSLEELEHMKPLPYIFMILKNINMDKQRKKHGSGSQEDTSEKLGRQKQYLAAQPGGMSIEDGQRLEATGLGVEEQVLSEITVKTFIECLPEELREPAKLFAEGYKINEVAGMLKLSVGKLRWLRKRLQKALKDFIDEKSKTQEMR